MSVERTAEEPATESKRNYVVFDLIDLGDLIEICYR